MKFHTQNQFYKPVEDTGRTIRVTCTSVCINNMGLSLSLSLFAQIQNMYVDIQMINFVLYLVVVVVYIKTALKTPCQDTPSGLIDHYIEE